MSWIATTAPGQADSTLGPVYERIAAASVSGRVAHVWQVLGGDPAGLASLHAHYDAVMGDTTPLSAEQVEMIAIVVSATNGCGYCVAHHGPKLSRLAGEVLARGVASDYREANLAARDRVLLDAAVALTCEPGERTQADVERLREYGFDDAAILKATLVAALYNHVNRVVSALGVPLEADREPWAFGAQR